MDSDVEYVIRQCRNRDVGAFRGERHRGYGRYARRIHRIRYMEVHRGDADLQAWRYFPAGSGEEAEEYGILAVRFHFLPDSPDGDRVGVYVLEK